MRFGAIVVIFGPMSNEDSRKRAEEISLIEAAAKDRFRLEMQADLENGVVLKDHYAFRWYLGKLDGIREQLRAMLIFDPTMVDALTELQIAGVRAQLFLLDRLVDESGVKSPLVEKRVNSARVALPKD